MADKKPIRGILKTSSSFDKGGDHDEDHHKREMKWDEMNILATYHPEGKDYGHKKIDEPPTPYSGLIEEDEEEEEGGEKQVNPDSLAERLTAEMDEPKALRKSVSESSDEDENETEEEREARKKFENKRKMHYNEFQAIKLARQLMEQDEAEDGEDKTTEEDKTTGGENKTTDVKITSTTSNS